MATLTHARVFGASDGGRTLTRPWVKNPSVVTAAGIWLDLSFFGRYPAANYFTDGTPLAAQALTRSVFGGLDHGEAKGSAYRKFLDGLTVLSVGAAAVPMTFMVMDYVLYYPLVPMEDTQEMDNTVTLPRHVTGKGVQIMLVEQFPYVGGGTVQVTYTNSDGVAGRQTALARINTQTALGTVAHSAPTTAGASGLFMPLAHGDGGVRAIESITFPVADAGNLAAILVKPLMRFGNYEVGCPSEWDGLRDLGMLEQIEDDAYLSLACLPVGSLNGLIIDGNIRTSWQEV